jgi:hypothetical protein
VLQVTRGITASLVAECFGLDLRTTVTFDSMDKYTFLRPDGSNSQIRLPVTIADSTISFLPKQSHDAIKICHGGGF